MFDLHPWARPDSQRAGAEAEAEERRGFPRRAEEEVETLGGTGFAESIRTTFPFDVTRRDIPLTPDDVHPTVVLTEDGLLLVVCPESVFVTLVRVVVDLRVRCS